MSYINWSDPEEMFGLLMEFVADERGGVRGDSERRRFLSRLLVDLTELEDRFPGLTGSEQVEALRSIHTSTDDEFVDDPVVEHLQACVEELERINSVIPSFAWKPPPLEES